MKSLDLDFLQLKKKAYKHTTQPSSTNKNTLCSSYGRALQNRYFTMKTEKGFFFVLLPHPDLSKNMNTDDV